MPAKHSLDTIQPLCMPLEQDSVFRKMGLYGIQAPVCSVRVLWQEIKMGVGCIKMDVHGGVNAGKSMIHLIVHHSKPPEGVLSQGPGKGYLHSHILIGPGCISLEPLEVLFHFCNSF